VGTRSRMCHGGWEVWVHGVSAIIYIYIYIYMTASVVYWSEFLATDTEVPGSIPGATRFSE